ncbi:MAG: TCR/Tet family MFS transporter [Gammaproteobacteria bacterium]
MTVAPGRALFFVLVTIFIDTAGFGIIIPVLPRLLMELLDGSLSTAALYGGWLMFLFSALQFVSAPVLGNLSDHFGRRPVLLGSLAAFSADFVVMGLATTVGWLFFGRALSGVFSATYSVASAYVADLSTPEDRAKSFGLMGAAWGLGFVVGPAIGGLLGDADSRLPFFVAAGLAAANVVYGYFALPESLAPANRRPFSLKRANPVGAFRQMRHYPLVVGLLGAVFLYHIAHDANPSTWTYVTMAKFNWTPRDIGLSMSFVGVCAALVQGLAVGPVVKRLGEHRAMLAGFALFSLSFLGYAFATAGWMMYFWIVPFAFGTIASIAVNALLSRQVPANQQGELQGAISSVRSITACIAPVVMTGLFSYFTSPAAPVQFPGASFFAAGLLTAMAMLLVLVVLKKWGHA